MVVVWWRMTWMNHCTRRTTQAREIIHFRVWIHISEEWHDWRYDIWKCLLTGIKLDKIKKNAWRNVFSMYKNSVHCDFVTFTSTDTKPAFWNLQICCKISHFSVLTSLYNVKLKYHGPSTDFSGVSVGLYSNEIHFMQSVYAHGSIILIFKQFVQRSFERICVLNRSLLALTTFARCIKRK